MSIVEAEYDLGAYLTAWNGVGFDFGFELASVPTATTAIILIRAGAGLQTQSSHVLTWAGSAGDVMTQIASGTDGNGATYVIHAIAGNALDTGTGDIWLDGDVNSQRGGYAYAYALSGVDTTDLIAASIASASNTTANKEATLTGIVSGDLCIGVWIKESTVAYGTVGSGQTVSIVDFVDADGTDYGAISHIEATSTSQTMSWVHDAIDSVCHLIAINQAGASATIDTVDSPVLDAEQNFDFTTSGFGTVTTVKFKSGTFLTDLSASLTGTAGTYTADANDVAALVADTVGSPFTTASHTTELEVGDGTLTATIAQTRNAKAGWFVIELLNPVKTTGSVFENFIGTPISTDQLYYPTANNTNDQLDNYFFIDATGLVFTNILTGTTDVQFFDTTDGEWKQFSIINADAATSPPSITDNSILNNPLLSNLLEKLIS